MAKKSKGIPWGSIIVAAVVLAWFYKSDFFTSSNPPAPAPAVTAPAPQASVAPKALYALMPAKNTWPTASVGDSVAADLLAQNYYLVVDGSGSMSGKECVDQGDKLTAAKAALKQFVAQVEPSANMGVLVFDQSGVKERLPLGKHNPAMVKKVIDGVQAGGGTPLSSALDYGYQALTKMAGKQLGYGEYHLVVVTDGEANEGYDPTKVVQQVLADSPVLIHTIGFCIRGNHSLNQTGLTLYKAANDPASLNKGLTDVLAEAPDFTVLKFEGQ